MKHEQGERIYDPEKDFSDNSALILTSDLETWIKDTAHPLPKWVWARLSQGERTYMYHTGHVISDGQKDWLENWPL